MVYVILWWRSFNVFENFRWVSATFLGQYPSSDLFLADCLLCHWSVCLQGIVVQATLIENWKAFTREICLHKQDTECTQPMLHCVHSFIDISLNYLSLYLHKIRLFGDSYIIMPSAESKYLCKLVYPTLDNLKSSINWKFIETFYISIPFATSTQKRFWELKKWNLIMKDYSQVKFR